MKDLARNITNQIRNLTDFEPDTGIILGSGWGVVVSSVENKFVVPYESLSGMPTCDVKGHNGNFIMGSLGGKKVILMDGRFHLYEGKGASQVVLPLQIMKNLNIKNLIITNSAGGVNTDYNVGDIMVISDHINFSGDNPLIGIKATENSPIFINMGDCYNNKLIEKAVLSCKNAGAVCHKGTYLQLSGPSYETSAEIKAFRFLGADAVGMSTAIESIYARYLKLNVLAMSCITNMAAGINNEILNHSDVLNTVNKSKEIFEKILINLLSDLD